MARFNELVEIENVASVTLVHYSMAENGLSHVPTFDWAHIDYRYQGSGFPVQSSYEYTRQFPLLRRPCSWYAHDFNAAFTAGTSSSIGRMSGTGPSGVIENGLTWRWLLV